MKTTDTSSPEKGAKTISEADNVPIGSQTSREASFELVEMLNEEMGVDLSMPLVIDEGAADSSLNANSVATKDIHTAGPGVTVTVPIRLLARPDDQQGEAVSGEFVTTEQIVADTVGAWANRIEKSVAGVKRATRAVV
jgi:hypothetical protein